MPPSRTHSSRPHGPRSSSPSRSNRPVRRPSPREEETGELEFADALGATVDEAIKNALEILGADPDEVEVQVLEKGHRSFLGLGRSTPYRVRVSWREDLDQEVIEEEVPERESLSPPPRESMTAPARPAPARPAPRERVERRPVPPPVASAEPTRTPRPAPPAPAPQPSSFKPVPRPQAQDRPAGAPVAELADQVRQLLRKMGFDASVDARAQDDEIWIRIRVEDEEDAFLLHGRRGETRAALQHLLQRILLPRTEGGPTVLVDINDRWEQRLEDLRGEALELARRAVEEGRPVRTRPLPSEERRIVHRALADRDDVRTHSEGDGREKRVVITPSGS